MKQPNRERINDIQAINAIQLDDDQKLAKQLIYDNQVVVITGGPGCLAYDTKVVMYDGTLKKVQDVVIGDYLMGPDSKPRTVLELKRGREQMYWVRQKRGIDYRVNENHILSLKKKQNIFDIHPKVINISVKEYLSKNNYFKKITYGYKKYPLLSNNILFNFLKFLNLSKIIIEKDVVDEYYGFTLDGDNLFLLEDFTVTHNSGKSLVTAQAALDFLKKKMVEKIYVTRAAVEVGKTLGFIPGNLNDKFDPYMEAFVDNVYKCHKNKKNVEELIEQKKIIAQPIQFIRGKTIDDVLCVEESQNLSKAEMYAILTRLGKTGKIIINGDNGQKDIKDVYNGLDYVLELSKFIPEIKHVKLKSNHRSDLVGKIIEYESRK